MKKKPATKKQSDDFESVAKRLGIAASAMTLLSMPAFAADVPAWHGRSGYEKSGNDLLADCSAASEVQRGVCLGYTVGFSDGLSATGYASRVYGICIPDHIAPEQLRDIVVQQIHATPDRDAPAPSMVIVALRKAFPCGGED